MSPRVAMAVLALALGCPSVPATRDMQSLGRRARTIDASTLRTAMASIGTGGAALLEVVGDSAWVAHHGSTEAIRGGAPLRDHLREMAAAYPELRFEAGAAVPVGRDGWVVGVTMTDPDREARAELVAFVRTRRKAIVSIELFGADPRGPFAGVADVDVLAGTAAFDVESTPSPKALEIARSLGERATVRLSARSDELVLAIVDVETRTKDGVPLVRHVAAIADAQGAPMLFENPREGTPIEMGNYSDPDGLDSRVEGDALRWGAWLGYCCEQGEHTRMCDRIRTREIRTCRATGRLALVCREAYHCEGAECFCCAHGIDGACAMDHVPEIEIEVPQGRRPPEPSIWSPY